MKKKLFSTLLCVMMGVTFFTGCLTSPHKDSTAAYTMASDDDVQGKEVGSPIESTTWLQKSGSPALTIVDTGGVRGISVTGRSRDWDCIDLKNLASLPGGFDYTVKVIGSTVAGARMKLSQPAGP